MPMETWQANILISTSIIITWEFKLPSNVLEAFFNLLVDKALLYPCCACVPAQGNYKACVYLAHGYVNQSAHPVTVVVCNSSDDHLVAQ